MNPGLPRATRLLLCLMALVVFVADAPADDASVREYLDTSTAATVLTLRRPLVFARERTELAVNARDYFYLVPVDINRGGRHRLYWFIYAWSTIVARGRPPVLQNTDDLVLVADDRPVVLHRATETLREAGIAELPLRPPVRAAQPLLFSAEQDTLKAAAAATQLSLQIVRDGRNDEFEPWRIDRRAVQAFVVALETGVPQRRGNDR